MKKSIQVVLVIVIAALLTACAPIQTQTIVTQAVGKSLIASVGTVIFRLNKTSDLPNVYGRADIYGGKVDLGFTEVRIASIESPTSFTLVVSDVDKASTETVLDRYQPYIVEGIRAGSNNDGTSVNVTNNINPGGINGSAPSNSVRIDLERTKMFAVGGHIIHFDGFDGTNLTYRIEKQ